MTRLTIEQIVRDQKIIDISSITSLDLSHRAISDVSCLASFTKLEKLDLSFNCLSSLEELSSCVNLKWLSVVENKLVSLKGIEKLSNLTVFNAGKNKLQKFDEVSSITSLRALILNDNNISSICKLDQLQHLNTLVLSRNPIFDISKSLKNAKSLTKLSLSQCHLEDIGASLSSCVELKELRLAHNKIVTLSAELAKNGKLLNLDLGNNLIENISELKVLSSFPHLRNLNLQGNPIMEKSKLENKVKQLVPNLRVFNSKPMDNIKRHKRFSEEDFSIEVDHLSHNATDSEIDKHVQKKSKKNVDKPVKATKKNKLDKNVEVRSHLDLKNDGTKEASIMESEIPALNDTNAEDKSLVSIHNDRTPKTMKRREDHRVVKIIEHKKKKGKSTDVSLLQMLTSKHDVGLGGPSTWTD